MEILCLTANTTVYIREKHIGLVQTALNYVAEGGNLTDIFSNSHPEAVILGSEGLDAIFLKRASVGNRRAAVIVAQAVLNGVEMKTTKKSDIFCSGCTGNCAK